MAGTDAPGEGEGSSKHGEHGHDSPKTEGKSDEQEGLLMRLNSDPAEKPTEEENPTKHDSPPPQHRSASLSSSSSSSGDGDFFQLDASNLARPGDVEAPSSSSSTPVPPHDDAARAASSTPNGGATAAEAAASPSSVASAPGSLSPAKSDTELQGVVSPTQSPPEQVMVRNPNDIQDPNRIPSSVFARTKSTAPMEWSVASNESLFSIQMGNNSFSRDHAILLGRSGELGYIGDLDPLSPPLAMTPEAANAKAMEEVLRAAADGHAEKEKEKGGPSGNGGQLQLGQSTSQRSDASATSINSFAFPILTGEGGRAGSVKAEPEKGQPDQGPAATPEGEATPAAAAAPDAPAQSSWCCISCNFCR